MELTTDQKGNIAEQAVIWHATILGIDVYRPVGEGGRYDMLFDLDDRLVRVQCKWAPQDRGVIVVRCYTCRRNREGILKRPYAVGEIDALAAYCPNTGCCYYLPFEMFGQRTEIRLRLHSSKNNQRIGINWAKDFEFAATLGRSQGAIAQLGERLLGMQKVAGSSPAGSIPIAR